MPQYRLKEPASLEQVTLQEGQVERAVRPRREGHDLADGVQVERPVDVGEGGAGFVAILEDQPGRQAVGVDDQQNQAGLAAVELVGRTENLLRGRAVDEPLGIQRVQAVFARGEGGFPVGSMCDVEDHMGIIIALSVDLSMGCEETRLLYKNGPA